MEKVISYLTRNQSKIKSEEDSKSVECLLYLAKNGYRKQLIILLENLYVESGINTGILADYLRRH